MKKILFIFSFILTTLTCMAQSQYISYEQMGMEDRQSESLQGKGGVLILSKVDDLVITIKQDESIEQENRGINADGLYEYVINVSSTN